ncbi:DoxX family membrane protein [bacterium]|nr:DoxX family membrane protein [bacterium]
MIESIKHVISVCDSNKVLALDIIRIYLGLGLFLKGVVFILNPEQLRVFLDVFPYPYTIILISHYVAIAHLAGGLLLCLGLLTRLSALIQLPVLLGAILLVHLKEGLFVGGELEFTMLVFVLLCVFFFFGSGKLSVDDYLETHKDT